MKNFKTQFRFIIILALVSNYCFGKGIFKKLVCEKKITNVNPALLSGASFAVNKLLPAGSPVSKTLNMVALVTSISSASSKILPKTTSLMQTCTKDGGLEKIADISLIAAIPTSYIFTAISAAGQKNKLEDQPGDAIGHEKHYANSNVQKAKARNAKIMKITTGITSLLYTAELVQLAARAAGTFGTDVDAVTKLKKRALPLSLKIGGTALATGLYHRSQKKYDDLAQKSLEIGESVLKSQEGTCVPGSPCYCAKTQNNSPEHNQHCANDYFSQLNSTISNSCLKSDGTIDKNCECLKNKSCFSNSISSSISSIPQLNNIKSKLTDIVNKAFNGRINEITDKDLATLNAKSKKLLNDSKGYLKSDPKNKDFQNALANLEGINSSLPQSSRKSNANQQVVNTKLSFSTKNKKNSRRNKYKKSYSNQSVSKTGYNSYFQRNDKFKKASGLRVISSLSNSDQSKSLLRGKTKNIGSIFKDINKAYQVKSDDFL